VSDIIVLPVYLPIRVKVATGLASTDDVLVFQRWKQQQSEVCASFGLHEFTPCEGLYRMRQNCTNCVVGVDVDCIIDAVCFVLYHTRVE